jgi:hypothetical protein
MSDEDRSLCEEMVQDYRSKVMGYCYNIQQINPADEFCLTALPPPSPNIRTQNILGDRARTGRLMVVPHLPVDFDGLPDLLQDAFDEDVYEAILSDESPLQAQEGDGCGNWRFALRFGYDFLAIRTTIDVDGPEDNTAGSRETTEFISHFGGRAEVNYRFPFRLFVSTGADYMIDYSRNGGNLHAVSGLIGIGYSFLASGLLDVELSVLSKLGYLFSSGPVYHDILGDHAEFSNFDASVGAMIDFVFHNDKWCFLFGLEGGRTLTSAKEDGFEIRTFPYTFLVTLGAGII